MVVVEKSQEEQKQPGGSCVDYELFDGDLLEISGSYFLPQACNTASGTKAATAFSTLNPFGTSPLKNISAAFLSSCR